MSSSKKSIIIGAGIATALRLRAQGHVVTVYEANAYLGANSPPLTTALMLGREALVLAVFLMVFLDFFIEPLAPRFDFWTWQLGFAPFQNFVAWFFHRVGFAVFGKK